MGKTRFRSNLLLRLLEYLSYLICFALFIVLMLDVWDKFSKKLTNMGVAFQENDVQDKELPCVTICPWPAFRSRNFSFTSETFLKQTFNLEDIIRISAMTQLNNASLFYTEEIRSVNLGRCYLIRYLKRLSSTERISITVQKQMDLIGGTQFWTKCIFFPWKDRNEFAAIVTFYFSFLNYNVDGGCKMVGYEFIQVVLAVNVNIHLFVCWCKVRTHSNSWEEKKEMAVSNVKNDQQIFEWYWTR